MTGVISQTVLVLTDSSQPAIGTRNFTQLAAYYGLTVKTVDLKETSVSSALSDAAKGAGSLGMYIHAQGLERVNEAEIQAIRAAVHAGASLYVDAFPNTNISSGKELIALQQLTSGAIWGLTHRTDAIQEWLVTSDLPSFAQHFGGHTIVTAKQNKNGWEIKLNAPAAGQIVSVVSAKTTAGDAYPVSLYCALGDGGVFVDAGQHDKLIGDAPQAAPLRELYDSDHFSAVTPMMMFFRGAYGDAVWHAPAAYANLNIDDSNLRSIRYDTNDYPNLLDQMRRVGFSVTIASVPRTYTDSLSSVVSLFRQNPQYLSIVVHGYSHDDDECYKRQPIDQADLTLGAGLDTARAAQASWDLPIYPVEVFPCGLDRPEVLPLLKKHNYIGTANAEEKPWDSPISAAWDLQMRPADLQYGNVPDMVRIDGQKAIDNPAWGASIALFNAFVGRPTIFWGHQGMFGNSSSFDGFNPVALAVNATVPSIAWTGMGDIFEHAYLWKRNLDGSISVAMYSHLIDVRNPDAEPRTFVFQKPETQNVPVQTVKVNGQDIPFKVEQGMLVFGLSLDGNSEAEVQIVYGAG